MQIGELAKQYIASTPIAEGANGTRGVEQLVSAVRKLTAGNIFEGTVCSIKGNQVMLQLSGGAQLAARMDANIQLVQGQSMFFQVKSNDGTTLAIRPYTVDGSGANLTLLHALGAANLPVKDNYLTMANTMMQEQMPIDRNSMAQMARILMAHPDVDVRTLVQMKKLELPITTEMIDQFENYSTDKSALHTAMDRFVSEMPEYLANRQMPVDTMREVSAGLFRILSADDAVLEQMLAQIMREAETTAGKPSGQRASQMVQGTLEGTQDVPAEQPAMSQVTNAQVTNAQVSVQDVAIADLTTQMALQGVQDTKAEQIGLAQEQGLQEPQDGLQEGMPEKAKPKQEHQDAIGARFNERFPLFRTLPLGVEETDSARGILQKLTVFLTEGNSVTKEQLTVLFSSKDMKELLKAVVEEQFFMEPEDVAKDRQLERLYERLEGKTRAIEHLMEAAGLKDTPLSQTVGDIRANIDFMNQVNQVYTYTQIPLKFMNRHASGQLYVYTGKRALAREDRELTAFLHLDLEHLGATDVSVRMYKKEVTTRFYMENDKAYELVETHIPQLEKRLKEKGYNCKIEVENEGAHVNFVDDFLKKDSPSVGMIHRYSFDVKA